MKMGKTDYPRMADIPAERKGDKLRKYAADKKAMEYLQRLMLEEISGNMREKLIYDLYILYKPEIISISKKYCRLSTMMDEEDFHQVAVLGLLDAVKTFRDSKEYDMKFSTFLGWKVRNAFQRAIGNRENFVEVYENDQWVGNWDYHTYMKNKRKPQYKDHKFVTKSRYCYISDILYDGEDLSDNVTNVEDLLREGIEDNSGKGSPETDQEVPNTRGNHIETLKPVMEKGDPVELQMIDAAYREWDRQANGTRSSQYQTIFQKIANLYWDHGKRTINEYKPESINVTKEDIKELLTRSIANSMANYESIVAEGRFSFFLETITRRAARQIEKEELKRDGN